MITWTSLNQDGSFDGVYAQQYDRLGDAIGDEFRINTETSGSQNYASIDGFADGGFVVAWESYTQDGSGDSIQAQRFDDTGAAVGDEFQVNSYTNSDQRHPHVAAFADGGFIVTWHSRDQDGSDHGIYAQRYNSLGIAVGSEFRVSTYTSNDQLYPSAAVLQDGGFIVSWSSEGQDGSGLGIYAQRYDSAGIASDDEFQVNTYTSNDQTRPNVVALQDGGFIISWQSGGQDGSGLGIFAQRYDADGLAAGPETRLNEITAGEQAYQSIGPGNSITVLTNGALVSTWSGFGAEEVVVRLFDLQVLLETDEDSAITIEAATLLANDTDVEGDTLTISAVDATSANGASVTINGNGDVVYDPSGSVTIQALSDGETLEDTFTYTVSDGNGGTDTATVTVRVAGANDAPNVVAIDLVTVSEDDAAQTINLLAGASDVEGDNLSITNITATDENGDQVAFIDNNDGTISIDPDQFGPRLDESEIRTVTVSFDVSDGTESTPNTATFIVTGAFDPNTAPIAVDDNFSDTNILFVSDNGTDADIANVMEDEGYTVETVLNAYSGGTTSALLGDLSAYDVIFWSASGELGGDVHDDATLFQNLTDYVSAGGRIFITGHDSIASPTDSLLISFLGGTSSRDLGTPSTQAQGANSLTTGVVDIQGVRPTGNYVDTDTLFVDSATGTQIVVASSHGGSGASWSLRSLGSGEIAYVSNGALGPSGSHASWTDTSIGGDGAYNAAIRNFAYAAARSNDGPDVNEDTPLIIEDATLLADDIDLEGETLSIVNFEGVSTHNAVISRNGDGDLVYDPTGSATLQALNPGETLDDTFTYTISDGDLTATASATITVAGANEAPEVVAINAGVVSEDDAVETIDLLAGASDIEGQDLSAINITASDENGDTVTFTDNGDGTISIDPDQFGIGLDAGESRTVTVNFDVSDGIDNTANTATLEVTGAFDPNIAPNAVDDDLSSATFSTIVLFDNEAIIDSSNGDAASDEAQTITASLTADGHVVTATTALTASELSAALDGADIFVLPEQEQGDLGAALDAAARQVIADFVSEGGRMIVSADTRGTLNDIFGFDLSATTGGPSTPTPAADSTIFAGGPGSLGDLGLTIGLNTASLPTGSTSVYQNANGDTTVALMPFGSGDIIHLGWDWYNATPLGSAADSGWREILSTASAAEDAPFVGENSAYTIAAADLLTNDTDVEGDTLTITAVETTSANGASLSINGDGDVVYDPTGAAAIRALTDAETLNDSFTYTISDGELTATATVTLTVTGINEAPVVTAIDAGAVSEDDAIETLNLLANASDVDGQDLSAINITATDEHGVAVAFTDNGDGTISIDPDQFGIALDEGESRTITVSFDVSDGITHTPGTATLIVTGAFDPNVPPVAMDDSLDDDAEIAIAPITGDIQVNTETNYDQGQSSIAALADGGFVVTWTSRDQDGSDDGVYAQRYDSAGGAVGSEFQVNTFTNDQQSFSSVAALEDGGFVITWSSWSQDGWGYGIYAQRYDSAGGAVGSEFRVNTFTNDWQVYSSVAALKDGGFVVTWDSHGQDGLDYGIFAQRYDSAGATVGSEFQVNTFTNDWQRYSTVAALKDGGFVVTWSDLGGQDGSYWGVYAQRYDSTGVAVGSEFQVNTHTNSSQLYSSVTALEDGGFVVTWSSVQDGSDLGIYAQRYDSAGVAVGSEFRVNTFTTGDQRFSSIVALADGGFVVTWSSDGQDGSGYGIYAQRYDADGMAVGEETRLNESTAGEQIAETYLAGEPTAVLANGTLVSTWSGFGTEEVFVRLFDLPGAATDEDTPITISTADLLANDSDYESDPLTITAVDATSANGASVSINGDGDVVYDPTGSATIQALNAGETLEDTFTYTVSDGNGGTDTATVTLTVAGADEAAGKIISVSQDKSLEYAVANGDTLLEAPSNPAKVAPAESPALSESSDTTTDLAPWPDTTHDEALVPDEIVIRPADDFLG